MSVRLISAMFSAALLTGCGLAGTGGAATVNGVSAAEEAKAAPKQLERVQGDVDAAQKKAAERLQAADATE
jgi:hypothetical protein